MPSIISQTELANLCGVSRQLVHKAIKSKHIKVNSKKKVIFDDPLTKLWYENHVVKNGNNHTQVSAEPKPESSIKNKKPSRRKPLAEIKIEEEISKIRADIRLKNLQYENKRGVLIEKEPTAKAAFLYLDALNIAMLDMPEMVADIIIDKIKSGASRSSIIKIMRDMVKTEIVNTKKHVVARLNHD